jgi:hypothetical protein
MSANNLPDLKRLKREDVPGAAEWIDPVLDNQGRFNETVYGAMNGNLTFDGNLSSQIYSASFIFQTGIQPEVKLRLNKAVFPKGVLVIKATRSDNASIDDAIGCGYTYTDGLVTIKPTINPLVNGINYSMTFLVIFS